MKYVYEVDAVVGIVGNTYCADVISDVLEWKKE